MKTVCELEKCTGCMACVDKCRVGAITVKDNVKDYCAIIDETKCVDCGACMTVCQIRHYAEYNTPIYWQQGWAKDSYIRENASSGGAATALALRFIEKGGYVCGCTFTNGRFEFTITNRVEDVLNFSGSKYVKSNPVGIYRKVYDALKRNKEVLFIGLPCQVAALKRYVGAGLSAGLYTIDLICHGTPSPKILKYFLKENGVDLNDISGISFRKKSRFEVKTGYRAVQKNGITDFYSIAFLGGLIYTENCYECNYARIERVSDITLGDSWGSDLPNDEIKKGISLILCQTKKGKKLIEEANLSLYDVDLQKAKDANHQLVAPFSKSPKRQTFFDGFFKSKKFKYLVFKAFPKWCIRQKVKEILIVLHIIRGGSID